MKTERDMLMYFQTTLRNAGLYTTVSFAALGYSRYYRGKDRLFNVSLIVASMIFMLITIYLSKYLIDDIELWKNDVETYNIDKYMILPKSVYYMNITLFVLALYTLVREIMK